MIRRTTSLEKIMSLTKPIRIVQGGTGAAKTFSILIILIDIAIANPGIRISVVTDVLPSLKKGAIRDFLNIMQQTNRFNPKHWNKSDFTYHFNNGSYMEFFGMEDEMKARGPRRDILYLNEGNRLKFSTANQLRIRTAVMTFIDFNPSERSWIHKEMIQRPDVDFISLTYKDNEECPQSTIDEINFAANNRHKQYWDNWFKVFGLGEIGNVVGQCFPDLSIKKKPVEAQILGYGMDFGYMNDVTTLVELSKFRDHIFLKQHFYQLRMSSRMIREAAEKSRIKLDLRTIADNDNRVIAELKYMNGFDFWNVIPVTQLQGKQPGQKTFAINLMNQYNINLDPTSKNMIDEFENLTWMTNNDGESLNKPNDGDDHTTDASVYICGYALQSKVLNHG